MKHYAKWTAALVFLMLVGFGPPGRAQEAGGTIDVLGFKFTVDDGKIVVEDDKLVLKGTGSLDLSPALGEGAVIKVDEMSLDHETTLKLKSISTPEINLGSVKARIAPDDIVIEKIMEKGIDADLVINVVLQINLAGQDMEILTRLPVTKDGLKDATIALNPPEGKENFLQQDFDGVVLTLKSGQVVIKNRAFQSFTFDGGINLFGADFALSNVAVTKDSIAGNVAPGAGATMQMGSIGLDLKGGVNFKLDASGFQVSTGEVLIDLATLIPGADGKIIISALEITQGTFHAEMDLVQTLDVFGVKLKLTHLVLDSEKRGPDDMYVSLLFDGAVSLENPRLDLSFTGFTVDSDGNVNGRVELPQAQELSMFGVGVKITGVEFAVAAGSFSVSTAGEFQLGDDKLAFTSLKIAEGKVNAEFNVSQENPFMFSWFTYLKINQFKIEDSVLTIGGQIDIPAPFTYTFAFEDVTFGEDGLPTAQEAGDALAGLAKSAFDAAAESDHIALVNTAEDPLSIAGFDFYIDAITLPNPFKIARTKTVPDTLLKLYIRSEFDLAGKSIAMNVDGLEVTKAGVKDVKLEIGPTDGTDSLLELAFFDWADLKIDKAVLSIKGGKLDSFGFQGAVTIDGKGFEVADFSYTQGVMQGLLKPMGDPYLALGGIKLVFQGEISFKIGSSQTSGSTADDTGNPTRGPPSEGGSFELIMKDVALDMTDLFGTSVQIKASIFSVINGDIHAELSVTDALDLFGLQMKLSKLVLDSAKPASAGGKREFSAVLDGSFIIPNPYIELAFINFKVSSSGEFGGDMTISNLQEMQLFGITFGITNIRIDKKPSQPLVVALDGFVRLTDSIQFKFFDLSVNQGKLSVRFDVSEEKPFSLPYCDFIKITQIAVKDNNLALSGFLQIPDPINVKLVVSDVMINSSGQLVGGAVSLGSPVTLDLQLIKIVIKTVKFDLTTRYFSFSGEIKMPSEVTDATIPFDNIGMSLAQGGSSGLDTSQTKMTAPLLTLKAQGIQATIQSITPGMGSGKFFVNMKGSLSVSIGGYGFSLNFENLKIYQDASYSIGKVTGGIEIAGFKIYISQFELDPQYTLISGGMSLPGIGGFDIQGLKIYKDGSVELESFSLRINRGAYILEFSISYKNQVFRGEGSLVFMGKGIRALIVVGPTEWYVELEAMGLQIPLFPGIFLDSIEGGVGYNYNTEVWTFKIGCGLAIGNAGLIYGKVSITIRTDGLITIKGELKALQIIPLAEAELVIDIPNSKVTGWCKINTLVYGVVLVQAKVDVLFSPNEWYVKATATADVFGIFRVGNASFYVGSNGLEMSFWVGCNLGIIKGEMSFYLKVDTSFNVYAKFHASASIDLFIAYAGGSVDAIFQTNPTKFDGTVSLKVCVGIDPLRVCASCGLHFWIDSSGAHASW